jgi:FG-GAP-like repeat/FG-GAP repeat
MLKRFLPHATRPTLTQLESREVPAVFYVDPTLSAAPDGSSQTFNAGKANQVTGQTYGVSSATPGATVFSSFKEAFKKSEATAGADTIMLANGTIPVDNSAGIYTVTQDLTIQGSGKEISTLKPTNNNVGYGSLGDADVGLFEVAGALNFNAMALGLDGAGKNIGIGFYFEASKATFDMVSIANIKFGNLGTGIYANKGATLSFGNSAMAVYGREGITMFDSTGNINNSVFVGTGSNSSTDRVNYGVQYQGGSNGTLLQNTFVGNREVTNSNENSAGVLLSQQGTSPNVSIIENGFINNAIGVLVGTSRGNDNSVAVLRKNSFLISNDFGVVARNNVEVDAKYNYWGARNGPNDVLVNGASAVNPYGQGVKVDSFVNFQFYYKTVPSMAVAQEFAVAATDGTKQISLQSSASSFNPRGIFQAYDGKYTGKINVATGDVNGDGVMDIAVSKGTAAGSNDTVQIFDGTNAKLLANFSVFGNSAYTGGVSLALGDVNGDGKADLIVAPEGPGGGPSVRVFNSGAGFSILRDFFTMSGATSFTGGLSVASSDVDSDGYDDIVVGSGVGGNSRVQVFGGRNISTSTPMSLPGAGGYNPYSDFTSFEKGYAGQVYVSAGDFNGDGRADLLIGAGDGGGGRYRAYTSNVDGTLGGLIVDQTVLGYSGTGGISVSARDINGDNRADINVGFKNVPGDSKVRSNYAVNLINDLTPLSPGNYYPGTNGIMVG